MRGLTPFGEWFHYGQDQFNQAEFCDFAGINKNTMTTLCNRSGYIPSETVMRKVMAAVKRIDSSKRASHFWDI